MAGCQTPATFGGGGPGKGRRAVGSGFGGGATTGALEGGLQLGLTTARSFFKGGSPSISSVCVCVERHVTTMMNHTGLQSLYAAMMRTDLVSAALDLLAYQVGLSVSDLLPVAPVLTHV